MEQMRLDNINAENITYMQNMISALEQKIGACLSNLDALDPTSIMRRGYSAVTDKNGRFINTVKDISQNDTLIVYMQDGSIDCTVDRIRSDKNV